MKTENTSKEFCIDIIERIEKLLPLEYELLIRTNHDSDGLSGSPRSTGNWFAHLIKCKGHIKDGNTEQKTIYKGFGDDLCELLCCVEKIVNENRSKKTYLVKRPEDSDIVSIMYDKTDQKYHFVNMTKNHICSYGFDTIDDAIYDMEKLKSNGEIIDCYRLG